MAKIVKTERIFLIIFVIAAFIRFIGTNPSYNLYHSDEGISYSAAMSMIINNDIDPLRYDYPALIPEINAFFFKTIFIPANWVKYYLFNHRHLTPQESKKVFQEKILGTRWINVLFWGRYVTALFSLGNVLLLYLVVRKLFNQKIAWLAAFLLTVNFRAVTNAQIGLPDTYNAFFVLLSFYLDLKLLQKPSWRNYLLAGLGMGLSFSTKYQAFIILPFALVHLYISWNRKLSITLKNIFTSKVFVTMLLVPVVFTILNPYFFIHLSSALKAVNDVSIKYGIGNKSLRIYPFSYFYHIDYGAVECLIVLFGLLIAICKYLKSSLLILSFVLPFFYVMVYYSIGGFYVRNFITPTPLVLSFAAVGIVTLKEWLDKKISLKFFSTLLVIGVVVAAIYTPLRNVLIHDYYYTKPWIYDEYLKKDDSVLPDNFVIATHPFHQVSLNKKFRRIDFEMDRLYSLAEFQEQGAGFALINMDLAGNAFYAWMNKPLPTSLSYWNKPVVKMNNTFWGLSINQMMNYVLTSAYKPWQAPDAAMFLVKVPTLPENLSWQVVKEYHFDKDAESWKVIYPEDSTQADYVYDSQVGKQENGSLKYLSGSTEIGLKRITSPAIPVQPGKLYVARGMVKSSEKVELIKRNGFIRIDFYMDQNEVNKAGERAAVSSRYQGKDWQELTAFAQSPNNAKFMRVSFQIADQANFNLWLDDLQVEESRDIYIDSTNYQKIPFDDYKDLLYPNSHGNL